VDDVFDEAFRQLGSVDRVACSLLNESTLLLESDNGLRIEIPVRRAKGILRLMCARLAVRASEWARREVSPYGDSIVFDLVKSGLRCAICFPNTPDVQKLEMARVEVQDGSDRIAPAATPARAATDAVTRN
jgi:hypothetical protein